MARNKQKGTEGKLRWDDTATSAIGIFSFYRRHSAFSHLQLSSLLKSNNNY